MERRDGKQDNLNHTARKRQGEDWNPAFLMSNLEHVLFLHYFFLLYNY